MNRTSLLVVALSASVAQAQLYTVKPPPGSRPAPQPTVGAAAPANKTLVSVELLANGVGLSAQQWLAVFEQMGVDVRVRQGNSRDKVEVTETQVGPLRKVTVVGELDRQGRIVLPDRTFGRQDAAKLEEYLKELQTFGQQGRPDGKPLWGLSQSQFGAVFGALAHKVEDDVQGLPLTDAVAKLGIAKEYPVRLSTDAAAWLKTVPHAKVRQSVADFGQGTALAMLLNDHGLGFRPLRTPAGTLELVVEPLSKSPEVWPVGWEPKESLPKTAPGLYQMVPVELNDVALVDLLNAVSVKTKVPVRYDHRLIEKHGVDLDAIRVDYPRKNTSWSILLRGVTNAHKLQRELRVDENGQPFVWVTTLKVGRLGR